MAPELLKVKALIYQGFHFFYIPQKYEIGIFMDLVQTLNQVKSPFTDEEIERFIKLKSFLEIGFMCALRFCQLDSIKISTVKVK